LARRATFKTHAAPKTPDYIRIDMQPLLFDYDKISMALLATITILLLIVLVATDGGDTRDEGDSASK